MKKDILSKYYTETLKRLNNRENKRNIIITDNCIVLDGCTALFTKEHPFKSNSDFNSDGLLDTIKNDLDGATLEEQRYTYKTPSGLELMKIITVNGDYVLVNTKYSKLFDENYFIFKCDVEHKRVFVFYKGVVSNTASLVAVILGRRE